MWGEGPKRVDGILSGRSDFKRRRNARRSKQSTCFVTVVKCDLPGLDCFTMRVVRRGTLRGWRIYAMRGPSQAIHELSPRCGSNRRLHLCIINAKKEPRCWSREAMTFCVSTLR